MKDGYSFGDHNKPLAKWCWHWDSSAGWGLIVDSDMETVACNADNV